MGSKGLPCCPFLVFVLWKGRWLMAKKQKRQEENVRIRTDSGHHRRIFALMALLGIIGFIPAALRLYDLMVIDYDYYRDLALRNQSRVTAIAAKRGSIYDRNMKTLACGKSVENVYLNPRELRRAGENMEEISRFLGELLEKDPAWIADQAKDTAMRYKQIAADVEPETAEKIRAYMVREDIAGIHLEPDTARYYPQGSLAAQVIGFTNDSGQGSEGVEAAYNSFLQGTAGKVITSKGNNEMDMPFSYEAYQDSIPGCDVILTLDATVQACLENQMQKAIDRYAVQNGAFGMVMDVKTGEILAMATLGNYDPNNYLEIADEKAALELEQLRQAYLSNPLASEAYVAGQKAYRRALYQAQLKQWRNRVLSDGYEPGSTFKVLTMAAALDSGAITLENTFHCGGSAMIPGRAQLLHCWRAAGHGTQKTAQALQNSCNLAFANIALKLGGETFYEYIKNFGIMEKTGIDLGGESKGIFFDRALVVDTDKWGTASLTSGSFGQTFKLTPLQLVRAISAVVNGGNLMEPYIVSEVLSSDGKTVLKQEPTVIRRVISEETSKTMCTLLQSVVQEGTAKNASVAGFSIGGKTGTSEKIDVFDENGQRVLDKIVSFVGVAPMDDPQYIVLVALDTPSRSTGIYISGGVMAAPTVGAVMADILPYLGVKQNYTEEDLPGKRIVMPSLVGMTAKDAEKTLKELGLTMKKLGSADKVTDQLPAAGQILPGGSETLVYFGDTADQRTVKMPNFIGMTRQQAADAAGKLGIYILVTGNNSLEKTVTATAQSILANTEVPVGTTVEIEFKDTGSRD